MLVPGDAMLENLVVFQAVLAAGIIVLGGFVEGYGYGLSLGTKWPYTRNIGVMALAGDPEAWHRLLATLLGVNAVVIVLLRPGRLEVTGVALIALTALLGMATLYVLAGKAPAVLQGLHGIIAYLTLLAYLLIVDRSDLDLGTYLRVTAPFHAFLLVVFLGGATTGQRGYQAAIGYFTFPRTAAQWMWAAHGLSVLLLILTLALYASAYGVALLLVLVQVAVGVLGFHAVNTTPARPGMLVPVHQILTVLSALAIFFAWRLPMV